MFKDFNHSTGQSIIGSVVDLLESLCDIAKYSLIYQGELEMLTQIRGY